MPSKPSQPGLSHLDEQGRLRMVDVTAKSPTERRAVAEARVRISRELEEAIRCDGLAKGNALEVARLAGIMAAKRTWELIPLTHPLPLDSVELDARLQEGLVYFRSQVKTTARTGVEMEALTAVALAALTLVDMGKSVDSAMVIERIRLIEKSGGRRGLLRPHESEFPA